MDDDDRNTGPAGRGKVSDVRIIVIPTVPQVISTVVAAVQGPGYNLKIPAGFDFSTWEIVPDWGKVFFPFGTEWVSTKATDGKSYIDPTFFRNYAAFKQMPYQRGAYHFFEPNDIAGQVANYCSAMLKAGWKPSETLIHDVEYTPPGINRDKPDTAPRGATYAYQVKCFQDGVQKVMGVRPIIYSSIGIVNQWRDRNGMLPDWIKDEYWWLAWYPYRAYIDTNLFVPHSMIPEGIPLDHIVGWQYGTDWRIPGIPWDGVDVNMMAPALQTYMALQTKGTVPVPVDPPIVVNPPVVPTPMPTGVQVIEQRAWSDKAGYTHYQNGALSYHVVTLKIKQMQFLVTPYSYGLQKTTDVLKKYSARVAMNAGGFVYTLIKGKYFIQSTGFAASQGVPYPTSAYLSRYNEEDLYFDPSNNVSITIPNRVWNAAPFPNRAVIGGLVVPFKSDTRKDPIGLFGVSKDGETAFLLAVDGSEVDQTGCSKTDAARIAVSLGADLAVILDSGRSVSIAYDNSGVPALLNHPCEGEQAVMTHLIFR